MFDILFTISYKEFLNNLYLVDLRKIYLKGTNRMIDGLKFKNQLISANKLLLDNIEIVNSLNVFPVPDGDTGTNMSLTMQDGIKKIAN